MLRIPTITPVPVLWADVRVGMMTFKGIVTAMDSRYTVDGAILVTVGTLAPTIVYGVETVGIYGQVA